VSARNLDAARRRPAAARRHTRRAAHVRTGLHRVRGEITEPAERSHAPIKDRLRAMRGPRSVATGQRVLEAVGAAQAVHRGDLLGQPRAAPAREGQRPTKRPLQGSGLSLRGRTTPHSRLSG
jgi:hypothetical protein